MKFCSVKMINISLYVIKMYVLFSKKKSLLMIN